MANPIGVLFLIISVAVLLIFGMGAFNAYTEEADTTITEGTEMYGSYSTSKDVVSQAFNILSYMIWPLIAVFVFAILAYLK